MLTLAISHNIYLSKEQRYSLYNGTPVKTTGVSVPIYFYRGATSEPAVEVFCEYQLTNANKSIPIKVLRNIDNIEIGYKINMPQLPEGYKPPKRPSDKAWRKMSKAKQEDWYAINRVPQTALYLLDLKDGGSQHLNFREYNKIKQNGKVTNIIYYVDISTFESLNHSLC